MKLLIVEDSKKLNNSLKEGLRQVGFEVDTAFDGQEGLDKALINDYDLIVLDLNLPKIDGIEVGRKIRRENKEVAIIALTARDGLTDKIKGLNIGFDDYMVKPFSFDELVARINVLLRRVKPNKDVILKTDNITLDPLKREMFLEDQKINLSKIEFNILEYLLRHKGIVVSNADLIEHIWNEDKDLLDPPIRSHIKNLRKKIKDNDFTIIQTVPGVGYKIE